MYWLLCLHGHNNLSALEDRHIEKQGNDYNVVLFKEEDQEDLVRYLDALIAILIESTTRIHKFLGTAITDRYQQYQEKFDAVRKIYAQGIKA
jgi:ribosomal protein L19